MTDTSANYEITLRHKKTGNRRSIILWADSFADAEKIVNEGAYSRMWFDVKDEEIIRIDKEYESVDTFDEAKRMEFLQRIEPEV